MTHENAFLQAILEYPNDDAPRLIYADWLEEHGDPRGDFIRIQCRLGATSTDEEERSRLERYERELLARHQDRWLGELRPLLSGWTFRRGFLVAISVHAAAYLRFVTLPQPATVCRVRVDLVGFQPPLDILELVPESIARENVVLPIGVRGRTLVLAAQEAQDLDMLAKLQFIFNRWVELVAADRGQIVEAINRLYGNTETEYVDCVLHEFVDSAFSRSRSSWPTNEPEA